MTAKEAHRVVAQECRKRGRIFGASNKTALRAMRAEIAFLHEHPQRARNELFRHFILMRRPLAGQAGAYRSPVRFG